MEVGELRARVGDVNETPSLTPGPQMNGGAASYGLDDHIYQRLLRERIVFLGSEVRDQNANAICAQMLLLNAEDPAAAELAGISLGSWRVLAFVVSAAAAGLAGAARDRQSVRAPAPGL